MPQLISNLAAALQQVPDGVGFVAQVGHANAPTNTIVIFNNAGTLSTIDSSGTVAPIGGGGGGDVTAAGDNTFTGTNTFENNVTISGGGTVFDASTAFSAALPTATTVGGNAIPGVASSNTWTETNDFTHGLSVTNSDLTVTGGSANLNASGAATASLPISTTIGGDTPATLGANQTFTQSNSFSSTLQVTGSGYFLVGSSASIGLFGQSGTGQGAAIPDATDEASAISGLNSLLAYLRTRGDIAT